MNELTLHQAAQHTFLTSLERQREGLVTALQVGATPIDGRASIRTLVRLARARPAVYQPALTDFETAVRAALVAYVSATPKAARRSLHPDAQFLVEHFNRFAEVPVTATWVQRVVIWARRNYRAWRKADREQARTDRS